MADSVIRSISTDSSLREQLRCLNEKYDTLKNVKERAAERYKVDFKKWRAFNDWLFAEDTKHNKYRNEPGITYEEKKQRDMASIMRKKQMMIEIGPDLARFEGEPEDGAELESTLLMLTIHNDVYEFIRAGFTICRSAATARTCRNGF